MIRYIIIASVFLCQSVYITATENTLSMRGGAPVKIKNGKFMVSIWFHQENARNAVSLCNGVIINEWFILSVYTCFSGITTRRGSYEVRIGNRDRSRAYNFGVESTIQDGSSISNIVLFRLQAPLNISSFPPIDLPYYAFTYGAGRTVTIMGYEKKRSRWILSKVNTTLIERDDRPRDMIFASNTNYNVANILSIDDIGSLIFLEGGFIGMVSLVHIGDNLIKGINIQQKIGFIDDKIRENLC